MINNTQPVSKDPWAKAKGNFSGCLVELICLPVRAYVISVALELLHGYYPGVPEFGFWNTMLLIVAVNCLPIVWRLAKSNKEESKA